MTHAHLRLAQGDTSGARRVLESLLEADPEHRAARELLEEVGRGAPPPRPRRSRRQRPASIESRSETAAAGDGPPPAPPARSRDPRIDRLERFMHALDRHRPPTV